jgi:DUF2946 family protein
MPAMKSRMRLVVAVAALAMHALAPFGVHAAAPDTTGAGDVCSVYSKARGGAPANAPSQSRSHGTLHCALCAGGSSSAAMQSASPVVLTAQARLIVAVDDTPSVFHDARHLSPPLRGPPLPDLPQ